MPFDFGLIESKILIELDGNQHFEQVAQWDSPDVVRTKDIEKIEKAVKEGYTVIHIYQEEVWKNKYNWQKTLEEVLKKEYNQPQVIFISKSINKYSNHIADLTEDIVYEIVNPTN